MAAFVTRKSLSRRTLLAGLGAGLALPWLDAMAPAFAGPRKGKGTVRSVFCFVPNGAKMDDWTPDGQSFSKSLAALKPLRGKVSALSGLALDGAKAHGDGPGDHARAAASFLTCAHPRKTGGADIHVGVSIDQVIARHVGDETRFRSLELGLEGGRAGGVCDSGYSCAYSNNVSWRTPSQPMAKETSPRQLFARLFGDPDSVEGELERAKRRLERGSVLDHALEDAKKLRMKLGRTDRRKLDEYLEAVRELEQRLQKSQERIDVPALPEGLARGGSYEDRVRLMYEIMALAMQADATRTISLMLGNGGSNISYRFIDVPDGHHNISHHGGEKEKLEKIQRIDQFHVEQFAKFLTRLDGIEERGKSLLHQSMIVYGSAIGDGNRHNHDDLPILLAGRGGGALPKGRHESYAPDTPLANLYLSMLRGLGIAEDTFGDAQKPLF